MPQFLKEKDAEITISSSVKSAVIDWWCLPGTTGMKRDINTSTTCLLFLCLREFLPHLSGYDINSSTLKNYNKVKVIYIYIKCYLAKCKMLVFTFICHDDLQWLWQVGTQKLLPGWNEMLQSQIFSNCSAPLEHGQSLCVPLLIWQTLNANTDLSSCLSHGHTELLLRYWFPQAKLNTLSSFEALHPFLMLCLNGVW